ncbi:UNVERIFIED_CONTAM: Pentatricopeptide repeat-containing protein, mitochondrial [Sesamum latifolium]|uniref:Pentatricopeptide repeat-containing protein, mitochondrial n=1 Tax=Sesamum latifolium TaxID=2727402 RepID=A0AAW2XUV7_9LAMI
MRVSTMALLRRGFAAKKRGTFTHPLSFLYPYFHDVCRKNRPFSPKPRIDFSCIHEVDDAVFLFREMVKMRPQPSVVQFTKLLSIIVKMKQYRVALNLFEEMRQSGAPVNEYTSNIVINCYCLLNRVDFWICYFGSLLDDKVTEAEKFFKKLLNLKLCEPDEIMILTVINGLCKAGHTLTAYDLLGLFENTSCKPDVYSYSTVIDSLYAFCNEGKVKEAEDIVKIMMQRNISPNVVTYTALVDGYCLVGQIDKVRKLFDSMPDRWADGVKVFKDMEAQQLIPNLVTYNTLLNGLCMNKQIAKAFSFMHVMEDKDVHPDITTYGILINGLCKDGKLEIARNLFNSLPSKGLQANVQIYTIIIGSLCQGLVDQAKRLLVEMEKSGCVPNSVTFNVCIQNLLKQSCLSRQRHSSMKCTAEDSHLIRLLCLYY